MLRKYSIMLMMLFTAMTAVAQSSNDIHSYISKYRDVALKHEREYGVPASITLAQGILESGSGRSALARKANNHFGIKAYGGWKGPIYEAWDDETRKSRFRSYGSAADSYRDHALFLKKNSRYRSLFNVSVYDYRAWAIGLQKAGYATAGNYAKALIGYIDAYRLYAINGGVKLRPGKQVVITRMVESAPPVFEEECVMAETEESQEQEEVTRIVRKFVVEINSVRCTILYPGETLSSVAMKYDIPLSRILEYNELSNISGIHEGDVVYLERKKKKYSGIHDYYRAAADDTLYGISQQFGITMASLAKMNGITLFDKLHEGQKLRLK